MREADPVSIPLSALQHWCYCPRQCGLIHAEQAFEENLHTLRGQAVHQRVDVPSVETRPGLRVERSLPLWSDTLGLIGKADVVEFAASGAPYPVEYKHGSRNKKASIAACDELQLAAQALCLEEMTGHAVPEGAIYYATSRRRKVVAIDADQRAAVQQAITAIRVLLAAPRLPAPVHDERCRACSLIHLCQPEALGPASRLAFARRTLFEPDDASEA
jgi:CRISPR-associated exonuclease Cas4